MRSLIVLFLTAMHAFGVQYYVRTDGNDANSGTANTSAGAWKTLGRANQLVQPGDTINIGAGEWKEKSVITLRSGTAQNPIIWKGSGAATIISTTSWLPYAFSIRNDYIYLQDITFQQASVQLYYCNFGRVERCKFDTTTHSHIYIDGSRGTEASDWVITECQFLNATDIISANPCIRFGGSRNIVQNSYFASQIGGTDIFHMNGVDNVVRNNFFDGWKARYKPRGIASFGAITGGSGYTDGTYANVELSYVSGSTFDTGPTANITVSGGVVSAVTLVNAGSGFKDATTLLSAPAASMGGTGSGFQIAVASLTPLAATNHVDFVQTFTNGSPTGRSSGHIIEGNFLRNMPGVQFGNITDLESGENIFIGKRVYTFRTLAKYPNQILIGATPSDTLDNLIAAINGAAGSGTLYAANTPVNADVTAAAGDGDTMIVTAKALGTAANAITTTDNVVTGSWASTTLTGGTVSVAATGTFTLNGNPDVLGQVRNWTFRNNIVHNVGNQMNLFAPGFRFYNNTFTLCNGWSEIIIFKYSLDRGIAYNGHFDNNIFYKCGVPATHDDRGYPVNSGAVTPSARNNLIIGVGAGRVKRTDGRWTRYGMLGNSLNGVDPLFVGAARIDAHGDVQPEDFRLLPTSPAIGAGADRTAFVTTDYEGKTRGLPFDIGAIEYAEGTLPSDTTPPTIAAREIDATGKVLTLTFSELVQGVSSAHYSINGYTLSNTSGSGQVWTMSISPTVQAGLELSLVYASGTGRTRDLAGNLLASETSSVTNGSLEQAPDPPKPGRRGTNAKRFIRR